MEPLNFDILRTKDLRVVLASLFVGLLGTLLAFTWPRRRTGGANLPPGPAPGWLVGNRNQVPKGGKPWRWFRDLNLEYGEFESVASSIRNVG